MDDSRPKITIYTDGGADPNPGPGGWAAILIHDKTQTERELSGGHPDTTNNRMELTAALEALKSLKQGCIIDFYTDSEYLRKGISQWIAGWKAKNWKNVKNDDLWRLLDREIVKHEIAWHWVKGHAGNEYNERADKLASAAIPRQQVTIDPNITKVYLQISGPKATQGAGGWAAAVVRGDQTEYLSGGHHDISPNHLALFGAIQILQPIPPGEKLLFFCDNSYLFDGITTWVKGWREGGWERPPKFNRDWQTLDGLNRARQIKWYKEVPAIETIVPTLKKLAREAREQHEK